VWGGFSTRWYGALFRNEALLEAAWVTIRIAFLTALVATVLGTLAAIALVRNGRFAGRTLFTGLVYAPMVMPEVITGLALLLLFVSIGMDRGFWTVTLAHVTFTMCFVTVVVQSRLVAFDRSLEEAALDLPDRHSAADRARGRGGIPSRLHALARRPRHRELYVRTRRDDAAHAHLQPGPARRDARDQRRLDASHRFCDGGRGRGGASDEARRVTHGVIIRCG
jgi:hypothetical protein